MKHRNISAALAVLTLPFLLESTLPAQQSAANSQFEVGGPLAGVPLQPMPTQHGEPAGHPGALPPKMETEGLPPQLQLYPGSVENYRAYSFKYLPIRSFFDRQSQIKNWVAPNIPEATPAQATQYAAPVFYVPRHDAPYSTGKLLAPVPTVKWAAGESFALDLGTLDPGVYAVRVIAAAPPEKVRPFRLPVFLRARINDGVNGEISEYRQRVGYNEEFYSMAEFYFHAAERRNYRAQLTMDKDSQIELLVHNVSLDNVMAGVEWRALKTRTTLESALPVARAALAKAQANNTALKTRARAERWARDAAIWNRFPRDNAQGNEISEGYAGIEGVKAGSGDMTRAEIEEKWGKWVIYTPELDAKLPAGVPPEDVFIFNEKLGLVYTVQDYRAQRPLPDPYPFKDDGAGLFFKDPNDPEKGRVWSPIADNVKLYIWQYYQAIGQNLNQWKHTGNDDYARDAAMHLARFAYAFPTLEVANFLSSVVHETGQLGRDYRARRRETVSFFLPWYFNYVDPIMYQYDALFDYIKDNEDLAQSLKRFVPWVETPTDTVKLIDTHLTQIIAKRIMRYHYHTGPMDIAKLATIVGDNRVTDPWMDWLFTKTFIYPLPPAGIQDAMIVGTDRDGTEYIGSTFYAQGEGAMRVAASLDEYLKAGGNKKYDLSDPKRFPKPTAQPLWQLSTMVAGWDFLRIGDVGGPDKNPGFTFDNQEEAARNGWKWTQDPKFAFLLKHYFGRKGESDESWNAIEAAALKVPRAPYLDNRSRMMPMWAGVLETGLQHDDPRFRRAAYLRIGYGYGHHHDDIFDLQVLAHGLPATIDGGQRPGYAKPPDRTTRLHNTVEVNGANYSGYSWLSALTDGVGARYMRAEGTPPPDTTLYNRQVALIDVNEAAPNKLPVALQRPNSKLPDVGNTPNSYVFDVFRIAGGKVHTYNFHGPIDDELTWNASSTVPQAQADAAAQEYLSMFIKPEAGQVGKTPAQFEATWRLARETGGNAFGSEKRMLGPNFDPNAPRRYTRLHLFNADGAIAMRAKAVGTQWGYEYTTLMVQKKAEQAQESAFVAIVEPFVGEPFITAKRTLPIEANEADARRAVALEVQTKNGHTDVLFADGRPERTRKVGAMSFSGEFALASRDAQGLRQATLTGGTLLSTPDVKVTATSRERTGRVSKVDYGEKMLWVEGLSTPWPARSEDNNIFEIGVPGHVTAYTARQVTPAGNTVAIKVQRGADYYRSQVIDVDSAQGIVKCTLPPIMQHWPGGRNGWVASNEAQTKFWRADFVEGSTFKLRGAPVTKEDFGEAGVLRLWEYGVGDQVRQSNSVVLRRVSTDVYELRSDVPVTVSFKGRGIQTSSDAKVWQTAKTSNAGGFITTAAPLAPAVNAPLYLRVSG